MRRQAKASSAGSTHRRAGSLGCLLRGVLATRGASSDVDGSGTPSHRSRCLPVAVLLALLALLTLAPFSQAKFVVTGFGTSGTLGLGGQFGSPGGIAVNSSANGAPAGTSYVSDGSFSFDNRVQRFGPKGAFDLIWGQNVSGRDERQILNWSRTQTEPNIASLGTITLSFGGESTPPINVYSASNGEIRLENVVSNFPQLEALPSIGAGNIILSGNPQQGNTIRFVGPLGGTDVPPIVVDNSGITGLSDLTFSASTLETGTGGNFAGFEVCTIAGLCKEGSASTTVANGGQIREPGGTAVNQANGHVYVTESGNRRVSEFDPSGNFIRAWGWDVIISGKPNDNGTGFEVCDTTNGNAITDCKQGASGANGGEFGVSIGTPVTDSSGNVWVPDPTNRRIQEFGSNGAFVAAYGFNVDKLGGGGALEKCTSTAAGACQAGTSGSSAGQFANNNPTKMAFDSSGNAYAIDSGNKRVLKFDSAFTTATTFGTSTLFTSIPHPEGGPAVTDNTTEQITSSLGGARIDFAVKKVTGFVNADNNPATPVTPAFEGRIIELDPADASIKDTSLAGAGINEISGLAANDAAGTLYATTNSQVSPRKVLVLSSSPPPDPLVLLDPVTVKTDNTATFSATLNPRVGFLSCKFQYSTDQTIWTDVSAPACGSLASEGDQAISQKVTGLAPATKYFVRLQVSRPLVENSTVTSLTRSFSTDFVPPVVTDVGAIQVADTSARMAGTIDPRNSPTGYVFEYGTTPALGSSAAPLSIGSGTTPITVSRVVGGLSPDTTYYYKLVATNAVGSTSSVQKTLHTRSEPFPPADPGNCPNQAVRTEQSSTFLPECRAFEMVSPSDKNQGGAGTTGWLRAAFSRDGQNVAFCPASLFGEPAGQQTFACASYLSRRGPDSWTTSNPFPPPCRFEPATGFKSDYRLYLSPRGYERAVVLMGDAESCPNLPLDPAAPMPATNLYRQDLTTDPFDFDLLTTHPFPPGTTDAGGGEFGVQLGKFVGGSADFSHVVYGSQYAQTPDAPATELQNLYDWRQQGEDGCATTGGCLSLASLDPAGEPFATNTALPSRECGGCSTPLEEAISEDGRRIYFEDHAATGFQASDSCSAPCDLFMREGDSETFHVSASECSVACGVDSTPDSFLWADRTGAKAIFASCAKLTDASAPGATCFQSLAPGSGNAGNPSKLYRWDRDGAPGHRLLDISLDSEPADGSQPHALALIGASSDASAPPGSDGAPGNTVFFIAGGQLVSGEPTDTGSKFKLYRWRWNGGSPTLDYLAPYDTATSGESVGTGEVQVSHYDPNLNRLHVRVTPDGRYVLIQTRFRLDPAADRDSDGDLYRWSEADGWLCVSCQLPGVPSAGHARSSETFLPFNGGFDVLVSTVPEHTISDDGKRVFFETPDALVPEDVNGENGCPTQEPFFVGGLVYACADIYEWHDGTLSLLTSGTGSDPFLLMGATASGKDVFFGSNQSLIGWDVDHNFDIYDVRTGGGFPEPPAQPPGCEGDEQCHPAVTSAPNTAGAGTAVFEGAGNPTPNIRKLTNTTKNATTNASEPITTGERDDEDQENRTARRRGPCRLRAGRVRTSACHACARPQLEPPSLQQRPGRHLR